MWSLICLQILSHHIKLIIGIKFSTNSKLWIFRNIKHLWLEFLTIIQPIRTSFTSRHGLHRLTATYMITYGHMIQSHATVTRNCYKQQSHATVTCNGHMQRSNATVKYNGHMQRSNTMVTCNGQMQWSHATVKCNSHMSHQLSTTSHMTQLCVICCMNLTNVVSIHLKSLNTLKKTMQIKIQLTN